MPCAHQFLIFAAIAVTPPLLPLPARHACRASRYAPFAAAAAPHAARCALFARDMPRAALSAPPLPRADAEPALLCDVMRRHTPPIRCCRFRRSFRLRQMPIRRARSMIYAYAAIVTLMSAAAAMSPRMRHFCRRHARRFRREMQRHGFATRQDGAPRHEAAAAICRYAARQCRAAPARALLFYAFMLPCRYAAYAAPRHARTRRRRSISRRFHASPRHADLMLKTRRRDCRHASHAARRYAAPALCAPLFCRHCRFVAGCCAPLRSLLFSPLIRQMPP